ncbi:valine--tRNA ligase, partial [Candidatus Parcubacteria bacterium]
AQAIYAFTWDEYCDWYLELSKAVLNDEQASESALRGTRRTLVQVLETLLRLLHPIMPFITEEIWQRVAPLAGARGETIMLAPWPEANKDLHDSEADAEFEWIRQCILGVRRIRSGMNIDPRKPLPVLFENGSEQDRARLESHRNLLERLARIESITWLEPGQEAPESAAELVGEMKLLIPLAGLIDKEAELARLDKEIGKLEQEIARLEKKLANENFVSKAPEAVVQKERDKLEEARKALEALRAQRERIAYI